MAKAKTVKRKPGPAQKKAIALLDKWLANTSGYDERTWPILVKELRTQGAIAPEPKKPKRLMHGRDFDAWVWRTDRGKLCPWLAEMRRYGRERSTKGKWVRVKFVPVEG